MTRRFGRSCGYRLAALTALAMLAGACVTAPIYEAVDVPLHFDRPTTLEEIGFRIARAARMQDWEAYKLADGHTVASKRKGRHLATVSIFYSDEAFSIRFRNASEFKHSGDRIHKLYNEWVRHLETTILMEISSPD